MSKGRSSSLINFLRGIVALAALAIPFHASAQMMGQPPAQSQQTPQRLIQQIGPDLWVAGLMTVNIDRLAAPGTVGRQRRENWCWAASVQMILNLDGVAVTQEQVVQRIYGGDIDRGGTPQQIMSALSGWAFTFNGKPAILWPQPLTSYPDMIEELSLGWPLIVGMKNPDGSGHAEVITAVTYSRGLDGVPVFQSVVLRDPWPFNPSRVEMPWSEFVPRVISIIRNRVTYPQGI